VFIILFIESQVGTKTRSSKYINFVADFSLVYIDLKYEDLSIAVTRPIGLMSIGCHMCDSSS
jgi:hypothetical protein